MGSLQDAALYYASLGWNIFPLAPGQKTPMTSHGILDATNDSGAIREWWDKWPTANIGLACGDASGVYVIDVDVRPTEDGFESLKDFPPIPPTVTQNTPRGGVHYFYTAVTPPSSRNKFRKGVDIRSNGFYVVLAPSTWVGDQTCPLGGKYEWSPDAAPWQRGYADYPEFMRPATRAPWAMSPQAERQEPQPKQESAEVLIRASKYLAACDPAVQGSYGHAKLLYAASRLVHGFLLSDEQAYSLLSQEYNPRCSPPWNLGDPKDEKDFRRKITEARKLPCDHPDGWLINENVTYDFDLDKFLANHQIKKPAVEVKREELSQDQEFQFLVSPTGLLGELCSWINATAMREQPFLTLGCALTFLGVLFGRKLKDELGSRTNLYCMGIAPSSAGKNHAPFQIRRLASEAGCTALLGGDDIASDTAIEDRVSRQPATLFLWDEFGHKLVQIKSGADHHLAQVVSLLMKIYSSAGSVYLGREYADNDKQRVITQPCCCVYATSTKERFTSGIAPIELQDGWLSRCLVFHSPDKQPKQRGRKEKDVPLRLIERVEEWSKRVVQPEGPISTKTYVTKDGHSQPPTQIVVPTDIEAEMTFRAFDDECTEFGKRYPILDCLWSKGEENARRIGLICAGSESYDSPVISAANADYACRLVRYILLDFGKVMVPEITVGMVDTQKRKVLKIIEKFGKEGCEKSAITKASPELNRRDRDNILADLQESGEVAFEKVDKTKSVTYRFWTAENYVKFISEKT